MKRNKTFLLKESQIKKETHSIDAKDKILGRLAVQIASLLRGKNRPTFTPHMNCGDKVVVVNAGKVKLSGGKEDSKIYFRHSYYPGGHKLLIFNEMMKRNPAKVILQAVSGMLPKGRLGRALLKNLRIKI